MPLNINDKAIHNNSYDNIDNMYNINTKRNDTGFRGAEPGAGQAAASVLQAGGRGFEMPAVMNLENAGMLCSLDSDICINWWYSYWSLRCN